MTKKKTTNKRIPIILCAGTNGRAVIYGHVDTAPIPGQPVTLYGARMILRWAQIGLLGVASVGPVGDTRITATVPQTTETVWQEWTEVTPGAAGAIDGWPAWRG